MINWYQYIFGTIVLLFVILIFLVLLIKIRNLYYDKLHIEGSIDNIELLLNHDNNKYNSPKDIFQHICNNSYLDSEGHQHCIRETTKWLSTYEKQKMNHQEQVEKCIRC